MLRLAAFPKSGSETWRSVILLMQLRWIAVIGQLITIVSVKQFLHVHLPLAALLIAPLLLILVNLGSASVIRRRRAFSQAELFVALMIDVVALCWQLYHSGGATNPFTFLFLLQIVIGAVILEPRWSWLVALNTCLCMVLLTFQYVPLELPAPHSDNPFRLYIFGSLFCFLLAAVLLVFFVVRLDRNRRESDKALAALRQQAAEEDHIIRMGLLASGAAHELGTPLSSMSVILGDWAHLPEIKANGELGEDLADMRVELERCKTIVTGILMSAGEMRGENPSISTVHTLFGEIVEEWQSRMDGELRFVNRFGEDATIVADPGLRQVIGNVIDNAQEVSPDLVIFEIARESGNIVIAVSDIGPGFSKEMLARVGQPYSSTKGRDGGGLGLFLVVNVVRKLGGRVIVENREMGGATVRLILPLAALAYGKDNQA
ncbi:ATP-binding protein [Novosphingobium pentaromativorans]|uniref:histidine kinase n=1 Tax=Novosphingobium pentaromativorans US6-1 TaxID=1088721 RepID=G6E935_9SPHN|nr:ATP-binding protein [Novosphingobium pentaromativorans]AIT81144.1 histidine kinase [Novosphingobium pentaromativorans US6-1]EHJ62259.1 histidine kinase [Novosphingobium pentaromativorans US6-1]